MAQIMFVRGYTKGFSKYFNGSIKKLKSDYVWYYYNSKDGYDTPWCKDYSTLILNDGAFICPWSNIISIDVNGYKRPNMYGKDIFSFELAEDGHIKSVDTEPATKCPDGTPNADQACFARILENSWEMDY